MDKILDPKVDFIFKNIFGNENRKPLLISLLNAIFSASGEKFVIKEVTIIDSFINKKHLEDKYSVLDIKARLDDGSYVNIEMQVENPGNMEKRSLYYLSRLYSEQIESGDNYHELEKSIGINILDFNMINNDKYHNHFLFKEKETGETFSNLLQLHTIELKKYNKKPEEAADNLEGWIGFFKEPKQEVITMLSQKVPEVSQAFEALKVISREPQTRREFEIREKALHDKASIQQWYTDKGIGIGREEGRKEGFYDSAKLLKKNGLAIEKISKLLNIPIEKLKEVLETENQ